MESYLFYLTIFIGILTFALAAQAIILFFVYRRVARLADELEKTAARLAEQAAKIMTQVDHLTLEVKQHVQRYGDAGDHISTRVQQTVSGLLDSVDRLSRYAADGAQTVLREARATVQGVLSALAYLGRRPGPKQLPPPQGHNSSLH